MASGKEIRNKIKSVENTRKITKAMEMVAASKMRKAQDRMRASRPYGEKIRRVASNLAHALTEYKHPFLQTRAPKNVGIVLVTSDKGLCGGLNANVLRLVLSKMKAFDSEGVKFQATCVGNKGLFDDVEVKKALDVEKKMHAYIKQHHAALVEKIESTKALDGDDEQALTKAIEEFKASLA